MSDTFEITIEKLVTGGSGLGRRDGQAVFVPGTAPGDRVLVRGGRAHRGFLEGHLVEILAPGPGRREAPCPHYDVCGGCDLQHLDDDAQRANRRAILLDCLRRLGSLDVADLLEAPPTASPVLGHRNRLRLTAHPTGHYGLKQRASHNVVPIATCPVLPPLFTDTILPWLRQLPPVDQIVVRLDDRGGWLLSLFGPPARLKPLKRLLNAATTGEGDPLPAGLVGVVFNNLPAWGHDYLVVRVADHKFRVGHQSFFQGNFAAAADAIATARSWLSGWRAEPGPLADLYAGVGLFTLGLADLATTVLAVESAESAVRDLENNVRRDAVAQGRTTVLARSVESALADPGLRRDFAWADAVVVADPPRAGLGKPVLAALAELRPAGAILISCDPATLARDCAALVAAGYRVARARSLEMFPQTSHIESMVLLTREQTVAP